MLTTLRIIFKNIEFSSYYYYYCCRSIDYREIVVSLRFFYYLVSMALTFSYPLLSSASDSVPGSSSTKRILFVDSYHPTYSWSAGIIEGVNSVFETENIEMRVFSMDSKRHTDVKSIKQAALKAKAIIGAWKPDLVIASDDNASKYLIEPYYKNSSLPIVFCGVNWDAGSYGYPYKNATGMEEISLIKPLPEQLAQYTEGRRLGILSGDVLSDRKNVTNYTKKVGIVFDKIVYVKDIEQWKKAFLALQTEVDMLIIENSKSITGWDNNTMHQFILQQTKIPTGTTQKRMIPYVLLGFLQVPQEQGQYAAKTALRILAGEPADSISIVNNQQVNTTVNIDLAEQLGITFEIDFLHYANTYRWK